MCTAILTAIAVAVVITIAFVALIALWIYLIAAISAVIVFTYAKRMLDDCFNSARLYAVSNAHSHKRGFHRI